MENQYVRYFLLIDVIFSQEVMNKVFCPLRGEEESVSVVY